MIRISEPVFGDAVKERVLAVLDSGRLSQGPTVAEFERLCASMAGTTHAVAVANGTVALELALEAMGIGAGDEVVTSPFTFAATLNAILRSGAVARFADIRADFTIDPTSIEAVLTPRTRCSYRSTCTGSRPTWTRSRRSARNAGSPILEDAAQAHGASVGDRRVGSFGIGSFSFYATKNVAAGEGGVLTTDADDLAERLRVLRNQGMRSRYEYVAVGTNARMSELHAAVALPQLEALAENNSRRAENAERLSRELAGIPGLGLPQVPPGRQHVWHQYTVMLPASVDRSDVARRLDQQGVESGIYYPALVWDSPAHRDHPGVVRDPTPRALDASARVLSLPVHPGVTSRDVDQIAAALRSALGAAPDAQAAAGILQHEA